MIKRWQSKPGLNDIKSRKKRVSVERAITEAKEYIDKGTLKFSETESSSSAEYESSSESLDTPSPPPKRKRGRPRKDEVWPPQKVAKSSSKSKPKSKPKQKLSKPSPTPIPKPTWFVREKSETDSLKSKPVRLAEAEAQGFKVPEPIQKDNLEDRIRAITNEIFSEKLETLTQQSMQQMKWKRSYSSDSSSRRHWRRRRWEKRRRRSRSSSFSSTPSAKRAKPLSRKTVDKYKHTWKSRAN